MIAAFENYLRSQTKLSETDIQRISALAMPRKLRKNEFLLREGEVCRHKAFVVSGLLRTFGMTQDGGEHILQFVPEDHWALDGESYDQQTPTRYNIDAVEASEILLWVKADFLLLLADIPELKSFSDQLISRTMHGSRQRLLTALSATPEQKYEDFVRNFPAMLSRLPLRMIAAYLGMSLKTLTRIRHAQFQ